MLKIDNLKVCYGQLVAVRGISFEVPDNEIVALIGANGAGKSTTLMSISGIVPKKEGRVTFSGTDITDVPSHTITQRGLVQVPEGRHVFPKLSVEDNLKTGSFADQRMTKETERSRIEEMYQLFPRLKERRAQQAGTLSGGEQQMLAVARALMSDPELVMLDEPSMGLSPKLVEEIFEIIINIKKKGKTILLIEQNATMALQIADRGYVLELGDLVLEGSGRELLNNENVKKAYLGI